jgi:alginate O-acetyltransferase complex protein AlgJ
MKKFAFRLVLFLFPFILAMGIELFVLPIDFFTFRVWEAVLIKNIKKFLPGPFYPNMKIDKIEEGDLGHHTRLTVKKEVVWETDQYGYRKKKTNREKYDIVIIGESNIAGSSLTQKDMLSELLEERLNISVYPLAPVTLSAFFKEKRFIDHPPDIVIFATIERLIPYLDLPKLPREKKRTPFFSKLLYHLRENRSIQSIAVFVDRLSKRIMLNYFRAALRRMVLNSEDFLSKRNPLFFLNGKPVIPEITREHFDRIVQMIEGYEELFKRRGIRFIFLPIPNQENIYYEQFAMKERPMFLKYLISELKNRGIETIDTQTAFEEAHRKDSALLFHDDDSHWNPKGVKLIADLTVELIKKRK